MSKSKTSEIRKDLEICQHKEDLKAAFDNIQQPRSRGEYMARSAAHLVGSVACYGFVSACSDTLVRKLEEQGTKGAKSLASYAEEGLLITGIIIGSSAAAFSILLFVANGIDAVKHENDEKRYKRKLNRLKSQAKILGYSDSQIKSMIKAVDEGKKKADKSKAA